jgi:orotate phosphoribosyltransferase
MNREELRKSIFSVAYITGEFLLRSGKISNEYFDKYQFESRPELLSAIVEEFSAKYDFTKFDGLAALEMGGIPIATAISLKTGLPMVLVRKKAKEYGTCRVAEGMEIKGKKLLIVEDVVTSGGQIIISTEDLRKAGAIIEDAVCVIDREQGGPEALQKAGINLFPLFTMTELKS